MSFLVDAREREQVLKILSNEFSTELEDEIND